MKRGWIYRIWFEGTDHVYVGQTTRGRRRINDHLCKLRQGTHPNPHMQNVFDKYGEEARRWEVVEKPLVSDLDSSEEWHIRQIWGCGCMNASMYAGAPMRGRKHTEETRRKMSESTSGEKNPNYGKTFSEDHKRKLREAKKNLRLSEDHKRKLREAGKKRRHPEEVKRKISEGMKRSWAKRATSQSDVKA